jgi:protein-L-isoaspartate(D-aspartate) O-methyltransferase
MSFGWASRVGAIVVLLGTAHPVAAGGDREEVFARQRAVLVDEILARHIESEAVLEAMRSVERHRFVPDGVIDRAYDNAPLPIGHGQTISQPYIVARMSELLAVESGDRVLEVGTGSGYQAAVLAAMGVAVWSIEIVEEVAKQGAENLRANGFDVHLRVGDGYLGWPEAAPFDGIIVTCAPDHVPSPLQEQLAEGGRLVIPVGELGDQELVVIEKSGGELVRRAIIPVRFVPMTGPHSRDDDRRAPSGTEFDLN